MKYIASLITFLLLCGAVNAQQAQQPPKSGDTPFVLGVVDRMWSAQLGEERVLNMYLPDGYDRDTVKAYPVIYLLDGSANEDFVHIVGLVQFLTMIEAMPPTIVAGIANVDRRRDFTFPTTIAKDKADYPTTGKSEQFIQFVEMELQPYLQKKYRIGGPSAIIGQSLGGLLATEILLKKPQLFDNYIIVSPSLWWDNESLLKSAPVLLKALPRKHINVYIAAGNEGKVMEGDARQLANVVQQQTGTTMTVTYNPEPKENHLTILHNAAYHALMKLNAKK